MVFGLDTDSFLNAFYRMASRRGLPEEMFSDNGTNFKGADRELEMIQSELDETKINASVANKGVKWHFHPPLAPQFGGAHESMIKSAKRAINAILGQADITDEDDGNHRRRGSDQLPASHLPVCEPRGRRSADTKPLSLWANSGSVCAHIRRRDAV